MHSAGGWSRRGALEPRLSGPRGLDGRCLPEGERGWVGGGALSSRGRGPWSFRGSSQKRSDSGESDVGLRDHGSQADSVGGGLTQLQEAGGARAWGLPCSGHSPSVRFMRCPSASVE